MAVAPKSPPKRSNSCERLHGLHQRLQRVRGKELSQYDLAEETGLSQPTLSRAFDDAIITLATAYKLRDWSKRVVAELPEKERKRWVLSVDGWRASH